MAAKKTTTTTTKTGTGTRDAKKGRPTIPSSHARGGARVPARGSSRDDAPEGRAKRAPAGAATKPKAGAARGATSTRATAAKPGARPAAKTSAARKTALAAPKRAAASLGETSPGGRPRKAKSAATPGVESVASDAARDLAILIAVAGLEKKAVGLEILDVSGKVDYADFLVVMTGRSDRQVSALAQGIEAALLQKGKRALSVEGMPHASWVLMDFGDVVVHVFQDEARSLYDIEGLWMDAKRIPVPDSDQDAR